MGILMDNRAETQLISIARSLQDHIMVAKELRLDFAAQLLTMAMMEIKTSLHGISQQELDAFCSQVERSAVRPAGKQRPLVTSGLRRQGHRTRTQRN